MSRSRLIYRLSRPANGIIAEIRIPPSKSYTNRALIIAALCPGTSILRGFSQSEDSLILLDALKGFGLEVSVSGDTLCIVGGIEKFQALQSEIYVDLAGSSMRFLLALCSFIEGADIVLRGSERMHQRPIGPLVDALSMLGANIEYLALEGFPPLRVRGIGPDKMKRLSDLRVCSSISSQFLTALLLLAPLFKEGLRISLEGPEASRSYLDMTLEIMDKFGVKVNRSALTYELPARSQYKPIDYRIEADASGASYFFGMAALARGRVRILDFDLSSKQGDAAFPGVLEKMGAQVLRADSGCSWIEVSANAALRPIEQDMRLMPDSAPTLAVLSALAEGESKIHGLATLRYKESDRVGALLSGFAKLGISARQVQDSLMIRGGKPCAARLSAYGDHRIAMAFAMLASVIDGIEIEDPLVVSKSFPNFWELIASLGIGIEELYSRD